jgi:hypothetical protein
MMEKMFERLEVIQVSREVTGQGMRLKVNCRLEVGSNLSITEVYSEFWNSMQSINR